MAKPLLSAADMSRLIKTAGEAQLFDPANRLMLFSRMMEVRARMPTPPVASPLTQMRLDLLTLNETPASPRDGQLPLLVWLENALLLVEPPHDAVIQEMIARIAPGMPAPADLPDTVDLPEFHEAVVFQNDMLPVWYLRQGMEAARSVARLTIRRHENGTAVPGTRGHYWGTGWLIAKDLLLTNHHVIKARDKDEAAPDPRDFALQAQSLQVEFDADSDDRAAEPCPMVQLEASDPKLDYALIRVKPASTRSALPLAPQALSMKKGDYIPLNIIQHPHGWSKRVAIRNNLASSVIVPDVFYFTDTLPGSSGAPVFDDDWQVVALHRGSTVKKNLQYQGRSTAVVNIGSIIHSVLADLKAKSADLHAEVAAA